MSMNINIPVTQCISAPTAMQVSVNYYYTLVQGWVNNYLTEAQKKEMFGNDPLCDYNKINNFWYLLTYIQMIADQKQIDINNGIDNPCSYYAANFDCIIDYFECLNIDITPLLCIFGFYCDCPQTGTQGVSIDEISTTLKIYP